MTNKWESKGCPPSQVRVIIQDDRRSKDLPSLRGESVLLLIMRYNCLLDFY